jgi:hypothetical protein
MNTLTNKVEDLVLALSLSGNALDKYKVVARKGFYKSNENIIIWDKTTAGKQLESVASGQGGKLQFKVGTLSKEELLRIQNPKIELVLHGAAKRLSEDGVQETLQAANKKELRVETDIELFARSLYFENPLKSAGNLPPKVDKPTIYGIEWVVYNTSNLTKDVQVTAFLPPNVDWARLTMPATERISFNPTNGQITWDLGEVKPGTGYYLPPRRVFFNVILTPSVSQLGQAALLVQNQNIIAHDTFTDTEIKMQVPNLSTKILEAQANEYYFKVVK